MTALIRSAVLANVGLDAYPATVSAIVTPGQSGFSVTGHVSLDVSALRDRLRAALINSGFAWPSGVAIRVTTDSPAVLEPCGLDLAIAVAILSAAGAVPGVPDSAAFLAELGLDGSLRRARPPEVLALAGSVSYVLVAPGAARDIADVTGLAVVGCLNLSRVVRWLEFAGMCDALAAEAVRAGDYELADYLMDAADHWGGEPDEGTRSMRMVLLSAALGGNEG